MRFSLKALLGLLIGAVCVMLFCYFYKIHLLSKYAAPNGLTMQGFNLVGINSRGKTFQDDDLVELAKLAPNLNYLNLSYTNIGDDQLKKLIHFSEVKRIDITHSHVTMSGALWLAQLPKLDLLFVGKDIFKSKFDKALLKKKMPEVLIIEEYQRPPDAEWAEYKKKANLGTIMENGTMTWGNE